MMPDLLTRLTILGEHGLPCNQQWAAQIWICIKEKKFKHQITPNLSIESYQIDGKAFKHLGNVSKQKKSLGKVYGLENIWKLHSSYSPHYNSNQQSFKLFTRKVTDNISPKTRKGTFTHNFRFFWSHNIWRHLSLSRKHCIDYL